MRRDIAGYILAGGKNRRIGGRKKIFLTFQGKNFYEIIKEGLSFLENVYLSVEEEEPYKDLGAQLVADEYRGIGPMGGILSGLKKCREDALLVVPCDMVPFPAEQVRGMMKGYLKSGKAQAVCKDGVTQPFPAIYTKEMLPVLEKLVACKEYCMLCPWDSPDVSYDCYHMEDHEQSNINTLEDYVRLNTAKDIKDIPLTGKGKYKISLEEGIRILKEEVSAIQEIEEIGLLDSLGRCMAKDLCASIDQPPFARSPVDGYGVIADDVKTASSAHPAALTVIEEIMAGETPQKKVLSGQAVRIMTGAPIPEGVNAVIRQEDTDYGENVVQIYRDISAYSNYCMRGEDFKRGECLLHRGEHLDAARIAVAAGMGLVKIPVVRRPRIGVLTTGGELGEPGAPLKEGKIYNSNQYFVRARLTELGAAPLVSCHVEDDADMAAACIENMAQKTDLIITTGAVSVGKKDILHDVIQKLGASLLFWRLAFKPGSPVAASMYKGTCIISLSGNPFGTAVGMELLVRPLLYFLTGDKAFCPKRADAVMAEDFNKKSSMRRFVRAVVDGEHNVVPSGPHSSGILSSMPGCNCMIDIPAGNIGLEKGDKVCVIML